MARVSLTEREVVARVRLVSVKRLRVWVSNGWLRPAVGERETVYTEADLARAALIADLTHTMGFDEEAVPVVLSLIDQIHGLRKELKVLAKAVDALPKSARDRLRTRLAQAAEEAGEE